MTLDRQQISRANSHVRDALERAIELGNEIGIQVVAYLDGQEVINQAVGLADDTTGRPVDEETLFNVFSVTKAIAATALHLQVERGLVDYEAPVSRYWPEFAAAGKADCTVRHVITHRSGVPQMPPGTTVEDMCDWERMVSRLADLEPMVPPGTEPTYQAINHGWLVGEIVRRTDAAGRTFGQFIRDELGGLLDAPDLWIGIDPAAEHRVAKLTDASPAPPSFSGMMGAAMPDNLRLIPEIFERHDVRRAEIAGVGGIFSARSCARIWAMLAQGGELDGVRLLSRDLVATFSETREGPGWGDPIMFGRPVKITMGGYWQGGDKLPVGAVKSTNAFCHPGAGNSIAWADPKTKLAVAICHNRMFQPRRAEDDTIAPIADIVRDALGVASSEPAV